MEFLITSIHNTAMFLLATGPLAVLVTAAAIQIATGGHRDE